MVDSTLEDGSQVVPATFHTSSCFECALHPTALSILGWLHLFLNHILNATLTMQCLIFQHCLFSDPISLVLDINWIPLISTVGASLILLSDF